MGRDAAGGLGAKKYKGLVYVVAFTAALAGLLFGLDIGVISGALKFIAKAFSATTLQQEWVVSSLLWGAVLGTLLSGAISKRYGRKNTILLSAVIFALGAILSMLSQSIGILIGCRVFLGLAVGMASFTAPLYLSEIAPRGIRGALISMYQLMITIGIVLAFLSDTFFSTYFKYHGEAGGHWRIMLGILVIPATIMFIGVFFLPESPRWLLLKGRKKAAERVLHRVRSTEEEIVQEVAEIEANLEQEQAGWKMFKRNKNFRRAVFLGIGLQIIQQLTGINVVMYYAPKIFQAAGFAGTAQQMWGTVLVGVINVLATFIAIAFVDRWGRRPIMYTGFVVMGISMCIVGIAMPDQAQLAAAAGQIPTRAFISIAGLLTFIIGFAASAGPIIWVICSEIYPLSGRDFGITCSTATNWIANGIVGLTFLSLLQGIGPTATFLLYGGIEVLFIIFFLFWVPETKDVSLEKIAQNLLAGKKLRDIGR
ncbi:MAG: sugar porter family MFS transporter [PVC group bacterium]